MNFEIACVNTTETTWSGGGIVDTPVDMSPQQVMAVRTDARSDLFSVGCTLYELVTGRSPFDAASLMETLYKIVHGEPDVDSIPREAPWAGLRRVIAHALQKRPEDRYPDAHAMSTDLQSALKDLGKTAAWTT